MNGVHPCYDYVNSRNVIGRICMLPADSYTLSIGVTTALGIVYLVYRTKIPIIVIIKI